jgi:arylsulfatase A-like enzyme
MASNPDTPLDRRTFLKRGLLAGGALAGGRTVIGALDEASASPRNPHAKKPAAPGARRRAQARPTQPNILVIVVDQLRSAPRWQSALPIDPKALPNIASLQRSGVTFGSHYTASNDCTPARAALLTGLYTHQTGCMITGGSTLHPEFPTWGQMLREHNYSTWWFGKWHLTHGDSKWHPSPGFDPLGVYGFSGGTFPSPNGGPGQGWRVDPHITAQFEEWFAYHSGDEPWCTTVSLVNPHDIAWWYMWTDRTLPESTAPRTVADLPPNFESAAELVARHKPRLQRSFQDTTAASFGPVPFDGPDLRASWLPFLDLYHKLCRQVDTHVGQVLRTLQSRPSVADNTVILFTSDHGEYGAAHGLRGKGASAYEEAIRVPLIVNDRRKVLTKQTQRVRNQLTSSVDVAPLLLTIARGSSTWRNERRYAHIARRHDLAPILANPSAPGRSFVLHATDEIVTEFAIEPYAANAPLHVVAIRTRQGKYAVYANWPNEGTSPTTKGQQTELYDYSTPSGRLELHNSANHSRLEETLAPMLEHAFHNELRAQLPDAMLFAQLEGLSNYFATAQHAAQAATRRRGDAQRLISIR